MFERVWLCHIEGVAGARKREGVGEQREFLTTCKTRFERFSGCTRGENDKLNEEVDCFSLRSTRIRKSTLGPWSERVRGEEGSVSSGWLGEGLSHSPVYDPRKRPV